MNAHRLHTAVKRRREVFRKKLLAGCTAFTIILMLSIVFGSQFASAHDNAAEDPVQHKYYKSIKVESGDTLWGLAEQYRNTEKDSMNDYINEVKEMNGLESDCIMESQYLTVAYYDTQFK